MIGLKSSSLSKSPFFRSLGRIWYKIIPIIIIIGFIYAQTHLVLNKTFMSTLKEIPEAFIGYKIAHISDIANSANNIISVVRKAKPDVIVLSGGYCDEFGDYSNTEARVNQLCDIAPVYYIYNSSDNGDELENTNAINLMDKSVELSPKEQTFDEFLFNNYGTSMQNNYNKSEEVANNVDERQERFENSINSTIKLAGLGLYEYDYADDDAKQFLYDSTGNRNEDIILVLNSNYEILEYLAYKVNIDDIFMGQTFGTDRLGYGYTKGEYVVNNAHLYVDGGIGTVQGSTRLMNFPEIQTIILTDGSLKERTPLSDVLDSIIPEVPTIFEKRMD